MTKRSEAPTPQAGSETVASPGLRTLKGVAAFLGPSITARKVEQWRAQGLIVAHKIGGVYYVSDQELRSFLLREGLTAVRTGTRPN